MCAATAENINVGAIVVAAGSGERFGGLKQLAKLGELTALEWSVKTAATACSQVVVVLPHDAPSMLELNDLPALEGLEATAVAGGDSRFASVKAGLTQLRPEIEIVVVHDAVRPGATTTMFNDVVAAVRSGADAAVPTLPVFDTLKRVEPLSSTAGAAHSRVIATLDRSEIALTQTPQAFRRQILVAAHESLHQQASAPALTDDASLVESQGAVVVAVAGDAAAHKITTPADLVVVEALMGIE